MTTTERASFLNQPYGAYHHREIVKEDEELLHVGPGTPCGEWMRRYWQPVALSEELKDLPLRIKILCEDLVVFRDKGGRVGLLELHCSHRGTSLEFGLVSERGIRCCYHGWLYDVDGKVLETPGEPAESTFRDRLCHGAYPVHEQSGIVFAYMGPPDKKPPFPQYDIFNVPEHPQEALTKHYIPCNWLQIKENAVDPAHVYFLHTIVSGAQFTDDFGNLSEWDYFETPIGMSYIDTRRMGDHLWVRINDWVPPNMHQFPSGNQLRFAREDMVYSRPTNTVWAVPIDDTSLLNIRIRRLHEGQDVPSSKSMYWGQQADRPYEDRQRRPNDYEARASIYNGLARHGMEHLATTDRGVIMLRNIAREGIRAVQRGEDPKGVFRDVGEFVPTYGSQRLVKVPPAPTPEEDKKLMREVGRKVAEESLKHPPAFPEHNRGLPGE